MSRRTSIGLVFVAAALLALSVWTAFAFRRLSRTEQQFPSVHAGDSRVSVLAKLGKPNYHAGECGVMQPRTEGCAVEYVYSHPFAPIIPEYYVVLFSSDDLVTHAERWESP
jgi:HAMP domain-containing protein